MTQSVTAHRERRSQVRATLPRQAGRIALLYRVAASTEEDRRPAGTAADTSNIGPGGAFVRCNTPEPVGTWLQVSLRIPSCEEPLETRARVCWIVPADSGARDAGMGLQFVGLDPLSSLQLQQYCLGWLSLDPAA
jgi:uncharacterized protein (TIGR02266 family)